jgi:hypothetical protein
MKRREFITLLGVPMLDAAGFSVEPLGNLLWGTNWLPGSGFFRVRRGLR